MPPTLSDNRLLRLVALCGLYVAQGIPFGFVTIVLVAYLAERGATSTEIGSVIAMTSLPWSFKFLWGPVIDRFTWPAMGRRRPWILAAQTAMAATLGFMVLVPDLAANARLVVALVCLINIFASLQDVAVDALAVDLLEPHERGKANGLMYGCSYGGSAIGGAGIGWVVGSAGLRAGLSAQVLMIMGIMLIPLLVRERPGEKLLPWSRGVAADDAVTGTAHSARELLGRLAAAFRRRSAWLGGVLALVAKFGVAVSSTVIVTLTIQELGWEQTEFTSFQGAVAMWFGLGGSVLGGFLADLVGARRLAMLTTIALGALWIVFGLGHADWTSAAFVKIVICAEALIYGVFTVSLFAIFMGVSSRAVAASQFTAYMAFMNLSNTAGAWRAGWLTEKLGEAQVFVAIGVLQMAIVGLLTWIEPESDNGSGNETV